MTAIIGRPSAFSAMGGAFTGAFGNVDVTPIVDGEDQATVRGILRQVRETDLMEETGHAVEGVTHRLSLAAEDAATLVSGTDRMRIGGVTYDIRSVADDGRAMTKFLLSGDI